MDQATPAEPTVETTQEAEAAISKYPRASVLRHIESGTEYEIHLTPSEYIRLESTGEPAYAYVKLGAGVGPDSPVWFRGQSEIEDEGRYELIPAPPRKEDDPEWCAERDATEASLRTRWNDFVNAEVGVLEVDWDREATFQRLGDAAFAFAETHFSESYETNIGQPWCVDHAGKAGLPIWMKDHVKGFEWEISTIFEIPVLDDKPKMLTIEPITTHLARGLPEGVAQLTIEAVRPTDGQAGREDEFDFYDIKGFTTQGFGSRGQRQGLAISFQDGSPNEVGLTGVTIESLLAVTAHRLSKFQEGPLSCDYNQRALEHIQGALAELHARVEERLADGTAGTKEA